MSLGIVKYSNVCITIIGINRYYKVSIIFTFLAEKNNVTEDWIS